MKPRTILPLFAVLLALTGCSSDKPIDADALSKIRMPIINGKKVTGNNRLSTVLLYYSIDGGRYEFCTGSLISENYVLTAGHCVGDCGDPESKQLLSYARVGVGQSVNSLKANYGISKIYVPSDFVCISTDQGDTVKNDIAIIKLDKSVPSSVTEPSYIIPEDYGPKAKDIDYEPGTYVDIVGFGKTNYFDDNSSGTKYETHIPVVAYCSIKGGGISTYYCSHEAFSGQTGFLFLDGEKTNACQGDSGGPAFYQKDGVDYVMGVASFVGQNCQIIGAYTLVDDYRSFITSIVPNLPTPPMFEICDNGVDDNKDGLADCSDPKCTAELICQPEDCFNGKDDNGNGKADCADPACAAEITCQPENCSNGIDDNSNGIIDCEEEQCYGDAWCQYEHCDNGIDDNHDGLADCDDPACLFDSVCDETEPPTVIIPKEEICDNGADDNDDGLADCDDPMCIDNASCTGTEVPAPETENCSNGIDDNYDGLTDCDDPLCMNDSDCDNTVEEPAPTKENCTNNVDDNNDGLIDCSDPLCANDNNCKSSGDETKPGGNTGEEQPSKEICDNKKDDNNDGLADCEDPTCMETCISSGVDAATQLASSCSGAPRGSHPAPIGFALGLLGLLGLCAKRRKQ